MSIRRVVAASVVALSLTACAIQEDAAESDGTWVGTITTEGNVTTVVNESGSVWGGTARLVEEASIGVESGPDEYLLGWVSNVFADDRTIYVVQPEIPAVRTYDFDGAYIGNLGRPGQGPGEYLTPVLVAALPDGRRLVYDNGTQRINVYSAEGASIDTWPASRLTLGCCRLPMLVSADGRLWAPVVEWGAGWSVGGGGTRWGTQAYGPDGPEGTATWQPEPPDMVIPTHRYGNGERAVPFAPRFASDVAGVGSMVGGFSNRYRFEVRHNDGSALIVERNGTPIPVPAQHAEWSRQQRVAWVRATADPGWQWNGDEIPAHKPAFRNFVPTASGKLWVVRPGPSERLDDCVEDPIEAGYEASEEAPCWLDPLTIDAFDADGRYLGAIEAPRGLDGLSMSQRVFVRHQLVVAVVEDEAGTIMVKRYRLVLPGER